MLKDLIKKSDNSIEVLCISDLYIDGVIVNNRYLISSDGYDYKTTKINTKDGSYFKPKYFSKRSLNPILDNSFKIVE